MSVPATTSSTDIYNQLGLGQQSSKRATSGNDLGMDSFLTLMTTQMKNQDPTKPMDSSTYLGQLAQFASVKGLQQLDTRMQGMTLMMGQQQALQASDLVGKNAYIKTNTANLAAGATINGKATATAAGPIVVEVKDAAGNVVRDMNVTAAKAGDTAFAWDGLDDHGAAAAPGPYTFTAKSGDTSLDTQLASRIDSISYTSAGIVMNLDGHDNITFDQILSID